MPRNCSAGSQCSTIDVTFGRQGEYVASKQLTRLPLSPKHVGFLILYEGHATVDKNTMSHLNFNRRQMKAGTNGTSTAARVYHRFTARSAL